MSTYLQSHSYQRHLRRAKKRDRKNRRLIAKFDAGHKPTRGELNTGAQLYARHGFRILFTPPARLMRSGPVTPDAYSVNAPRRTP